MLWPSGFGQVGPRQLIGMIRDGMKNEAKIGLRTAFLTPKWSFRYQPWASFDKYEFVF